MPFRDRQEAAELLAEALTHYRGTHPLILAIPRGAVPMGQILAKRLDGELDVVLVRKLGAPGQPEYAIGSIDESGEVFLNPQARGLALPSQYLETEKREQSELLGRRRRSYTPHRAAADPQGRTVIVVDDGIATGSTMIAALSLIRKKSPGRLVAATAVAPPDAILRLEAYADQVICLETPRDFRAVGQFFEDFSEVSDAEVIALLSETRHQGRSA